MIQNISVNELSLPFTTLLGFRSSAAWHLLSASIELIDDFPVYFSPRVVLIKKDFPLSTT